MKVYCIFQQALKGIQAQQDMQKNAVKRYLKKFEETET